MSTTPFDQCPKCGENSLIYDGMLVWRSGPRPPRSLARKSVGFSPHADYERERIYHCGQCGAEFSEIQHLGQRVRFSGPTQPTPEFPLAPYHH